MPNFIKIRQSVAKILRFSIFQDGGRAISDCGIRKILLVTVFVGTIRITVPNFIKIGRSVAEILQFFKFSKWLPAPSWIFEIPKFYWLLGWRG